MPDPKRPTNGADTLVRRLRDHGVTHVFGYPGGQITPIYDALARMASWKGHFDEDMLKSFIRSLGIYPAGSLVRLASGRLAVVVEQNRARISAPKVKVFFSTKSGTQIKPLLLDLAQAGCTDKIVGREARESWPFTHLEELWRGEN